MPKVFSKALLEPTLLISFFELEEGNEEVLFQQQQLYLRGQRITASWLCMCWGRWWLLTSLRVQENARNPSLPQFRADLRSLSYVLGFSMLLIFTVNFLTSIAGDRLLEVCLSALIPDCSLARSLFSSNPPLSSRLWPLGHATRTRKHCCWAISVPVCRGSLDVLVRV